MNSKLQARWSQPLRSLEGSCSPLRAACLALSLLATQAADAQIYRWIDPATGATIISNNPPPSTVRGEEVRKAPSSLPSASIEKTSTGAAKSPAPATARTESKGGTPCDVARQNLAVLESNQRVSVPDGKGGDVFLDDAGRAAQLTEMRDYISKYCKGQ
jgi:hypothetical protein